MVLAFVLWRFTFIRMEKSSHGCGSLFLGVSFLSFIIFRNFKKSLKNLKLKNKFSSAAFGVLSELVYLICTCFSSHSSKLCLLSVRPGFKKFYKILRFAKIFNKPLKKSYHICPIVHWRSSLHSDYILLDFKSHSNWQKSTRIWTCISHFYFYPVAREPELVCFTLLTGKSDGMEI